MITLTNAEAVSIVRKNLEELDTNSSEMFVDDYSDNSAIDAIIRRDLPEAINAVVLAAPSALLEGIEAEAEDLAISNGVLSFSLASDSGFLRLVAFRAADSGIVVTDAIPEASPEGRKQLNGYIRGRFDRPRLIQGQGYHTGPTFKYYSLKETTTVASEAIALFLYFKEQLYSGSATGYPTPRRIRQNVLDYLTAMVMDTYNDQRAQLYYQKANIFPTI